MDQLRLKPCQELCKHDNYPEACQIMLMTNNEEDLGDVYESSWVWRFTYLLNGRKNPFRCNRGIKNLPDIPLSLAKMDHRNASMFAHALLSLPSARDPNKGLLQIMEMLDNNKKCLTKLLRPTHILFVLEKLETIDKKLNNKVRAQFLSYLKKRDRYFLIKIFSDRSFGLFSHRKDASILLQFGPLSQQPLYVPSLCNFIRRFYDDLKSKRVPLLDFANSLTTDLSFQILFIVYCFISFKAVQKMERQNIDTLGEKSSEYINILKLIWRSQCTPYITNCQMTNYFPRGTCINQMALECACNWYFENVLKERQLLSPQPRSLAQHCRIAIRQSIRCKDICLPEAIKTLCLPDNFNRYLNLEIELKTEFIHRRSRTGQVVCILGDITAQ